MISYAHALSLYIQDDTEFENSGGLFERGSLSELRTLTILERRHIVDVLGGMIFEVLGSGPTQDCLAHFLHFLSNYLELEWEEASVEVQAGALEVVRRGVRQERYLFSVKACTVVLFLLQARPVIPHLYEHFSLCCGSVQGGAGWILSAMVNSFDDQIRSLGVRCIVAYVERTARNSDSPLSLERPMTLDLEKANSRTIAANTLSMISNVGQGVLISNMGRGLAAIGPSVRSAVLSQSKLSARVVYKLLWHLLKSHRYRLGQRTQSSLVHMVVDVVGISLSLDFLKDHFLMADEVLGNGVKIDMNWTDTILSETRVRPDKTIRDSLGIGTVMRLLRFLPAEFTDQWLEDLVKISVSNQAAVVALARCPDWQPCLFQLISEAVEKIASSTTSTPAETNDDEGGLNDDSDLVNDKVCDDTVPDAGASSNQSDSKEALDNARLWNRFNLSLELYAALLGQIFRDGGDKVRSRAKYIASFQNLPYPYSCPGSTCDGRCSILATGVSEWT
jgi:hypothetical protein